MRQLILRRTLAFFFLFLSLSAIGKTWHWAKDGFSIHRITVTLPKSSLQLDIDSEIENALQQKYSYLSRGHQCYAFVSEDGNYVLKLPRFDLYNQPFWMRACHLPFVEGLRKAFVADKSHRKNFLLNSFQIAFEELKEETGLLYLHLEQTDHWHKTVAIQDRVHRTYSIDLDRTGFLLQKRREILMPVIETAIRNHEKEKAQALLNNFLELIALRAQKGIFNKDPSFSRNFGLDGSQVIQIDVGSFYRPKEGDFAFSFLQTTGHVKKWLAQIDLETSDWFQKRMEEEVNRCI